MIWTIMEDGKTLTNQVEIEFNNQVGAPMQQAETLMQDLFGLIQELVGIMLQYALALKHPAVVVTTD
tara:strand:- start:179 stop:379 length:201 start_codon:yes stop_codon:yes gene_type:complete